MDKSLLVRIFGFRATLWHGDLLTPERWRWIMPRAPRTAVENEVRALDVGCGTGAFTIGLAQRGYSTLGLSWDERNQSVARERAALCGAERVEFEILDVRQLDTRPDLKEQFDVAICMECIEHILDDRKLLRDISACLKPGGRLLLSTPNYYYRAIDRSDLGPFVKEETGWHVRRGYTPAMLQELCDQAGLVCEEVTWCGGYFGQKLTGLWRSCARAVHPAVALAVTFPLRFLPRFFDAAIRRVAGWPDYSICMVAYKPRFEEPAVTLLRQAWDRCA